MLKVALTGGIATGKTHVREGFDSLGVPTIDADTLAREVMMPSSPALQAAVQRFGRGILSDDGTLDRRALAAIVFTDEQARKDLEAIVHPAVYAAIAAWFVRLAAKGAPPVAIADVPLLYETGNAGSFDRVIVVSCPPETQLARVMARDGFTEAEARLRLEAQWPIGEKVRRADYVIETSGSFENTQHQVVDGLRQLRSIGP